MHNDEEETRLIKHSSVQVCLWTRPDIEALLRAPWERVNVHYHPSITHSLLIHLLTLRHTHIHTQHVHECWYALIHALNTRLDASETHLSPCNCGETILSASANVCMCVGANVSRQVSGQSNPLSNDWFLIWLAGRPPPPLCLLLAPSSFVIHFHFVSLALPPAFLCSSHSSSCLILLSILSRLFNVTLVLLFAALHPSYILPHSW